MYFIVFGAGAPTHHLTETQGNECTVTKNWRNSCWRWRGRHNGTTSCRSRGPLCGDDRCRIIVRIRRFVPNCQCSLIRCWCCHSTTRTIGVGVGNRWHRAKYCSTVLYFTTLLLYFTLLYLCICHCICIVFGLGLKTVAFQCIHTGHPLYLTCRFPTSPRTLEPARCTRALPT